MNIEVVIQNNWDFVLYKTDEGYILNVLFSSSFVDFYRSFKLAEGEENLDFEEIKKLSESIRNKYELYKSREIIPAITSVS